MKNKIILLTLTFFTLGVFTSQVYSQSYNENDKEGLRAFLRQESSVSGKTNIECLGLTPSDTTDWNVSESWIEQLSEPKGMVYIDWQWNLNTPAQLTRLEIKSFDDSNTPIAGYLNCSAFASLEYLDCSNCQISGLNIRGNKLLRVLNCSDNKITSIDTYENNLLEALNCSGNLLQSLNFTTNFNISHLNCSNNQLHILDVFENINLKSIACSNNGLLQIILPNSPNLESLDCSNNSLTEIALDKYLNLKMLSLDGNSLAKIYPNENTELISLYVSQNKIETLDVSANTALVILNASGNNIAGSLPLNSNIYLEYIYCYNNELESIDLSSNSNIAEVNCSFNNISSIYMPSAINSLQSFAINDNRLKFSNLPSSVASSGNVTEFIYTPQEEIDGGEILFGNNIDLSTEYNINENITEYKWTDESLRQTESDSTIEHRGNGIFKATLNEDAVKYCHMSNPLFPSLTLVYKVLLVKDSGIGVDVEENNLQSPFYYDKSSNNLRFDNPDDVKCVYIFDTLGRCAAQYTTITPSISTEKLHAGVYLVKVSMKSGKTITQKINM